MVCTTTTTTNNNVPSIKEEPRTRPGSQRRKSVSTSPEAGSQRRKGNFKRLASTRGLKEKPDKYGDVERQESGWVRVFAGPEPFADMKSQLIYLTRDSTVKDVARKLSMAPNLTVWIQYGGNMSRRLTEDECPLTLQDDFLIKLGFEDISRRTRLGIDPELRYLVRLHGGPAALPFVSVPRSGPLQVLKGLVFPNWKRRPVAIVGSKMLLYPGHGEGSPETLDISGGDVELQGPRSSRLVLRVTPPIGPNSTTPNTKDRHVYLGFDHYWERNLWFAWIKEATQQKCGVQRLDISGAGFKQMPDQSLLHKNLEEFIAGDNELGSASLECLSELKSLHTLHLNSNAIKNFPETLLRMRRLKVLNLADNELKFIPKNIGDLYLLEELKLDGNELVSVLDEICQLFRLKALDVARNKITSLPKFLERNNMRTAGILDINPPSKNPLNHNGAYPGNNLETEEPRPLSRVNLRDNQLKGNIILGNYGNLTQLDVSENSIEKLDLSALDNLEVVQCTKNQIQEIYLNGRSLTSLVADYNNIDKLKVKPAPSRLQHMDVSHNNFTNLPDWLGSCHELRILFANHNQLTNLPEHLFCSELSSLHTLRLGYNKLHSLPSVPRLRIPLQELFLQNNCLHSLPQNFFTACDQLKTLNLSNNRLTQLPTVIEPMELEKLYLTANCLNDNVMEVLRNFHCLRVLHLAYNCITILPEFCTASWSEMEELILSGNRILHLPINLPGLQHLRVLRIHSNRLQSTPSFSYNTSVKVLDLAHNEIDVVNLMSLVPKQLQFLDLSCNTKLRVDPKQFHMYRSQRPISLVDVSGQNRATLPTQPHYEHNNNNNLELPWKVGFSETAGNRSALCVAQLRMPTFCNVEGLFGIFDGGNDNEIPSVLASSIPRILLEERAVKETANEYMKYTILSAHRELKEKGQRNGACVTLCHIARAKVQQELGFGPNPKRYILRVASVGEASAVLSRSSGPVNLTPRSSNQRLGNAERYPLTVPNPEIVNVVLQESDEFIILANRNLWDVIDMSSAIAEVRAEKNVILAAKRLQDLAQGYGVENNLSVMVVKLNSPGTDVELLMRELRQTIKKSKNITNGEQHIITSCQKGCCCEYDNNCFHSINQPIMKIHGSDRSSPSGQSDHTIETLTMRSKQSEKLTNGNGASNHYSSSSKFISKSNGHTFDSNNAMKKMGSERRSYRGVARAIRARVEEHRDDKEETDSAVSEEQFKCWEYMLEQNTQLLFDKELNTISKGFTRGPNGAANLRNLKNLSNSSPQLAIPTPPPQPPLLARHFGSARSFNPALFRPELRFGSGRSQLNGGPHAAYFGSLQRLMPYNLEYDFAVIQERAAQDSLDQDGSRMQQYWGVATTEL